MCEYCFFVCGLAPYLAFFLSFFQSVFFSVRGTFSALLLCYRRGEFSSVSSMMCCHDGHFNKISFFLLQFPVCWQGRKMSVSVKFCKGVKMRRVIVSAQHWKCTLTAIYYFYILHLPFLVVKVNWVKSGPFQKGWNATVLSFNQQFVKFIQSLLGAKGANLVLVDNCQARIGSSLIWGPQFETRSAFPLSISESMSVYRCRYAPPNLTFGSLDSRYMGVLGGIRPTHIYLCSSFLSSCGIFFRQRYLKAIFDHVYWKVVDLNYIVN